MEAAAVSSYLLLGATAFVAGAMNAVGGGGSFLTFPMLVFTGVPSIIANASNTVALFPGNFSAAWGYRQHLRDFDGVSIKRMLAISIVGGIAGAVLLLSTPQHAFDAMVPWLLLIASLTFTFGPWLAPRLQKVFRIGPSTLMVIQFVLAVYGGYFGAAVGIMLLAAWSLLGRSDIHSMNAAKTILVGSMNCVATVCFIIAGKVWWPQTLTMMAAAIAGGYLGARIARRVDPKWIRVFIITMCFAITAVFFTRR
jgi:uncharacterized membrane protein YfcA